MGRVKTLKRREQAIRLKEKRISREGSAAAKCDAIEQDKDVDKAYTRGFYEGRYSAAKDCANAAKESSNIKKGREAINAIASRARGEAHQ